MGSETNIFSHRHLLSMDDLSCGDIGQFLTTAKMMKEVSEREVKKIPTLRGRTVINCFLEPSTRTRTSFEIAGKRLSADVINISASGSSMSKGESLKDMAGTLRAMNPDLIVIRSPHSGAPFQVSEMIERCSVVNAGDGRHEHPSQSLLDIMTISEHKESFMGLKVSIVGDILNSRVARSNLIALKKLGAIVTICGPKTLLPVNAEEMADGVTTSIKTAVKNADVVMMLRIQKERIKSATFPNLREYSRLFGLTRDRLKLAARNAVVMHPGPINRGIEIAPDVADGPWSLILDQVKNGVAVRMAILYLLLGAGLAEAE